MKLEEAIEILDECMLETDKILWPECLVAHKLGMEALERTVSNRTAEFPLDYSPLPSETEEDNEG